MPTHLPALLAPDVRKEWALPGIDSDSQMAVVASMPASRATTVAPAAHREETEREMSQEPDRAKTPAIDEAFFDDRSESVDDNDSDDNHGSPASKKLSPKPKASIPDQYKDWDNGEPLTTEQRQSIMALKSNYERSRAMNQFRNQRQLKELELKAAAESALDGRKDQKRKRPGKGKGKVKVKESSKPVDKSAEPTSDTNATGG